MTNKNWAYQRRVNSRNVSLCLSNFQRGQILNYQPPQLINPIPIMERLENPLIFTCDSIESALFLGSLGSVSSPAEIRPERQSQYRYWTYTLDFPKDGLGVYAGFNFKPLTSRKTRVLGFPRSLTGLKLSVFSFYSL